MGNKPSSSNSSEGLIEGHTEIPIKMESPYIELMLIEHCYTYFTVIVTEFQFSVAQFSLQHIIKIINPECRI